MEGNKFTIPIFIINLNRKPERYVYVREQLDKMGITNYRRVSAIDGFNTSDETLIGIGLDPELIHRKGIAGCAASHIAIWKHIAENKLEWILILEDDAHFHPNFIELFNKYWSQVPKDAKIIFPGYCADESVENNQACIIERGVMCLQGYIISWKGAKYLLEKLLPVKNPIDIDISEHFNKNGGSYIFNGNAIISGIRPNDYKKANGRRCMFNGIIYQNHEEQGSTIHSEKTVF